MTNTGQELFNFVKNRILIADEWKMIITRQFDKLGSWYLLRYESSLFQLQTKIVSSMNHKSRHTNGWQNTTHINLRVHLCQRQCRPGTRSHAKIGSPPFTKV